MKSSFVFAVQSSSALAEVAVFNGLKRDLSIEFKSKQVNCFFISSTIQISSPPNLHRDSHCWGCYRWPVNQSSLSFPVLCTSDCLTQLQSCPFCDIAVYNTIMSVVKIWYITATNKNNMKLYFTWYVTSWWRMFWQVCSACRCSINYEKLIFLWQSIGSQC